MFSRLKLLQFGKFRKVEIPLSRTTVVHGGNESGKTTLFDALATALSRPAAATPSGTTVAERYGDRASATLEGESPQSPLSPADAIGLLATREGELHFGRDAGTDEIWQATLEPRLRAATIDAAALAADFAQRASDDPELPHNRELAELELRSRAIAEQRRNLTGAASELEEVEAEETALAAALAERCAVIAAAEAAARRDRHRLEAWRESESRARAAIRDELERLQAHEEDLATLAALEPLREEDGAEIDELDHQVEEHAHKLAVIDGRRADAETRLRAFGARLDDAQRAEPMAKRVAARAAVAALRLRQALADPPLRERRSTRPLRLVLGAIAWVVGVGSVSGLGALAALAPAELATWVPYLGLLLGAVAGSVGILTARRVTFEPDTEAVLAAMRAEWSAQEAMPPLPETGAAEILAFLDDRVREHTELLREVEQHVTPQLHHEEELVQILARSRTMLESTLDVRQQARDAWLALRRVASRDEYAAALARRRETAARVAERIATAVVPAEATARVARRAELEAKRAQPLLVPADPDCPSEAAIVRAQQQIDRMQQECAEIAAHQAAATDRRGALEARIGVAGAELGTALASLATEQTGIEQEILARKLEKQSAAAASALFAELSRREDLHLDLLAEGITESLAAAGLAGVEVEVADLCESGLFVSDAEGELRPLAAIAAGRRDLTLLAARLALAEKLVDAAAAPLLVLEEPCARMSPALREVALRLVHAFQERTGWQGVVITRDPTLAAAWAALDPSSTVIDLAELAAPARIAAAA